MPSPDAMLLVVLVLSVALVAAAIALRPDFVIRHRPGKEVRVRGRVPLGKSGAIKSFFARDLGADGPVMVFGNFGPRRTLRLRFWGRLSPGQKQRVRNFLIDQFR
jgi:hypothetical protein